MRDVKGLEIVQIEEEKIQAWLARVQPRVDPEDYRLLEDLVGSLKKLYRLIEERSRALWRLLTGASTEKTAKVVEAMEREKAKGGTERGGGGEGSGPAGAPPAGPPAKRPGHGRNGAGAYLGAERIPVRHTGFTPGCPCPRCKKGKVCRLSVSGRVLRIVGQPCFKAQVWEPEKWRCNLCGEVFTAKLPPEAGEKKYDEAAGAMVALMKYGTGMPFHRMEALQADLKIPLPASTQWEIAAGVAEVAVPVHVALVEMTAQGEVLHNDDTAMRVLSLMKEIEAEGSAGGAMGEGGEEEVSEFEGRTGVFTSAIVAKVQAYRIALFSTGRRHAGENLTEVLRHRRGDLPPPIQMCDGLSRNLPKDLPRELKTILANCVPHARRKFVKVAPNFPQECCHVLEELREVYRNDAIVKERKMTPAERLAFHQAESGPVMERLHVWLRAQLDEKKVEPNSGMGKAILYMLKRWDPLTLFLRVAGAPLDNNVAERALKRLILFRKNSYFFKTENGARVGDILMSLIHTCRLNGVNPFDYLVALQKYADRVRKRPGKWLPWNYRTAIDPDDTS